VRKEKMGEKRKRRNERIEWGCRKEEREKGNKGLKKFKGDEVK